MVELGGPSPLVVAALLLGAEKMSLIRVTLARRALQLFRICNSDGCCQMKTSSWSLRERERESLAAILNHPTHREKKGKDEERGGMEETDELQISRLMSLAFLDPVSHHLSSREDVAVWLLLLLLLLRAEKKGRQADLIASTLLSINSVGDRWGGGHGAQTMQKWPSPYKDVIATSRQKRDDTNDDATKEERRGKKKKKKKKQTSPPSLLYTKERGRKEEIHSVHPSGPLLSPAFLRRREDDLSHRSHPPLLKTRVCWRGGILFPPLDYKGWKTCYCWLVEHDVEGKRDGWRRANTGSNTGEEDEDEWGEEDCSGAEKQLLEWKDIRKGRS